MLNILHVSTECYPAAKAGGMGDVVGALPIYSHEVGIKASVVIPKYRLKWFEGKSFKQEFASAFWLEGKEIHYRILKLEEENALPYPFYCVDMPALFDRPSIYLDTNGEGYRDEPDRNFSFQRAVLEWLNQLQKPFDLIHCHDHQTGLIPFYMGRGPTYPNLRNIPNYYTIHNAAYHGKWHWANRSKLPDLHYSDAPLLDWDSQIHSLATAIKCCWGFNTVSPTYLKEISHSMGNLSWLFNNEKAKSTGILNGIDNELWNPKADKYLKIELKKSWDSFKNNNKKKVLENSKLSPQLPLFGFIGRFAHQKGADILCGAIQGILHKTKNANFIILGTGDRALEEAVQQLEYNFPENVLSFIMYNEELAHQIYAASDFLLMPSRFEPCGLNQMFAMRFGTLPIVHSTGGLVDTVIDMDDEGTGIRFDEPKVSALENAMVRGLHLYDDKKRFKNIRLVAANKDFSWKRSLLAYKNEYLKLLPSST